MFVFFDKAYHLLIKSSFSIIIKRLIITRLIPLQTLITSAYMYVILPPLETFPKCLLDSVALGLHYVGDLIDTMLNFDSPWKLTRRTEVCLSCLPRLRLQQFFTSVNSVQFIKRVFVVMSFFPLACTVW